MAQKSDLDWQSEKGYSLKLENLQTGSDFEQTLIPPNCKSGKKSVQSSQIVIYKCIKSNI